MTSKTGVWRRVVHHAGSWSGLTSRLRSNSEAGERVVASALALIVVGSMLAIGSVHLPAFLVVAALSLAVGTLALKLRTARNRALRTPIPLLILLALAAYTLVQAAPL